MTADLHYMRSALSLARQGWGRTAPNPSVGCVIVKDGAVLGRARTADGGRPHAEVQALAQAGAAAKGATVYVTLEPCAHQGVTPPCSDALINAGVARVVVACTDPDPRVAGGGIEKLRAAGIDVVENIGRAEAEEVNKGFFLRLSGDRPMVTLKIASSADGRVSTTPGQPPWITSDHARAFGHVERAQHDAIAVGINTVLADDPMLSTRVPGVAHDPARIVFDTNLRIPERAKVLDGGKAWVVCGPNADNARRTALEKKDIKVITANDLKDALRVFAENGLTRLLIEGGPTLIGSFIKADVYDRLLWFRAPVTIGAGRDAVADLGLTDLAQRGVIRLTETRRLGIDALEIYERTR